MFKITTFCLRGKTRKKRRKKIINHINAIFGIILFIENDGHVINHVTGFLNPRYFISCCYIKKQEI